MTPEKKEEFLHLCPPDNEPDDLEMFACTAVDGDDECEFDVILTWSWDLGDEEAWGHALCVVHAHEVFGEELPKPKSRE